MFDVTEQDIQNISPVDQVLFGAPCKDLSKLRLLMSKARAALYRLLDRKPRPGLDGPHGKVFRQCLQITTWVLKYNPEAEVFCEQVDFSDLAAHWKEVCDALGVPYMFSAEEVSYTNRFRAYWSSFRSAIPTDFFMGMRRHPDPDECMEKGRKICKYNSYDKDHVRPLTASLNTMRPIQVKDEQHVELQSLYPCEGEALMGWEVGSTADPTVSAKQRLSVIGDGWDLNAVYSLMRFSKLSRVNPLTSSSSYTLDDKTAQALLVELRTHIGDHRLADALCHLDMPKQLWCINLLKQHDSHGGQYSVLDSGSSKHLSKETQIFDPHDRKSLTGFNGASTWTEGSGYIPIVMEDPATGNTIKHDIANAEAMSGIQSNILCMGKLVRLGWQFHFSGYGDTMEAVEPGGAHTFKVDLGSDEILRLPHGIRTGKDAAPLPIIPASVNTLKRSASDASYLFLYAIFNHCGDEKLYQTLAHTLGYKAEKFESRHCNTCAQAKARNFGLKQGTRNAEPSAVVNLVSKLTDGQRSWLATQLSALCMPVNHHPVFDDPSDDGEAGLDSLAVGDMEYGAPVAGRRLGVQSVPRFALDKLRPFEAMFVDNKDYPCGVVGGYPTTFIFVCYKTRLKAKVDIQRKTENGQAFLRIVARYGIHKLEYPCRVWSDGCGSMAHVELAASKVGIDHAYIPPHQQSLNEAEKVADQMWAAARAHILHSNAPAKLFGKAVDFAIYSDIRTATTASRGWLTPYEMVRGSPPSVAKMHVFFTRAFVAVPKSKRKALAARGLHNTRAEPGRFIGFHSPLSSTYAVMLDQVGHSVDRCVHSINVTFDDTDFRIPRQVYGPGGEPVFVPVPAAMPQQPSGPVEAHSEEDNPLYGQLAPDPVQMPQPYVSIPPLPAMPAAPSNPAEEFVLNGDGEPQLRPRPSYHGMCHLVLRDSCDVHSVIQEPPNDITGLTNLCFALAEQKQKDMSWDLALKGPLRERAIEALYKEFDSLTSTILEEIGPDHPLREEAERLAITGRILLDIKRDQTVKARGVKHGFKEDKATADGIGFNYSAHVAKFKTIRLVAFRPNRGDRRLAIKDVSVAFLQSDKYPEGIIKYICFKWPLTGKWRYFKQSGPIYGEASAPIRWENTLAPYLESEGFVRGQNDHCAFYHELHDIVNILWVDDDLIDADDDGIRWTSDKLDSRFKCKDLEWVEPMGDKVDYLGMELSQDDYYTYLSMCSYIANCLHSVSGMLGIPVDKFMPCSTPMNKQIDPDSPALDPGMSKNYYTMCGFVGWLQLTMRIDVAMLYSRAAQHLSKPNE